MPGTQCVEKYQDWKDWKEWKRELKIEQKVYYGCDFGHVYHQVVCTFIKWDNMEPMCVMSWQTLYKIRKTKTKKKLK